MDPLEAVITLAGLSGKNMPDDVLVRRYRIGGAGIGIGIWRQYTVATTASPEQISPQEATELLMLPPPRVRQRIELFSGLVGLREILLALSDPNARIVERAARLANVTTEVLDERLHEIGFDIAARKLGGAPWTKLPITTSWMEYVVVEKLTKPYGEMTLRKAQLLNPELKLGDRFKLPSLYDVLSNWFRDEPFFKRDILGPELPWEDGFKKIRPLFAPVVTPAGLKKVGLPPLRRLYPEDHGVLYVDVEGAKAQALWHKLDGVAESTGYRPVILGGNTEELINARLAWDLEECSGLQYCSHKMTDPQTVLKEALTVDVRSLLADGGNPSYPTWKAKRGSWPPNISPRQELTALRKPPSNALYEQVRIALIPTDAAWKAIAWVPSLINAGEATPSLAQVAAVSRHWEEKYGARLAVVRPGTIEWIATREELSRDEALAAAREHFSFTPEGGSEVIEERAAHIKAGSRWYAWWD